MPTPQELLQRLDSRHDELIRKLDELNAEIERALTQFTESRLTPQPAPAPSGTLESRAAA